MSNSKVKGLIVLFGATGDLASRKLYPALYRLYKRHLLSDNFAVIGTARREWSNDYYRQVVAGAVNNLVDDQAECQQFVSHFHYVSHDATDLAHYNILKAKMDELEATYETGENHLYYLSTAPSIFPKITKYLKEANIVTKQSNHRVILEKPFGSDLASAQKLNDSLSDTFKDNDIYRIDHYLGKEMVQNILALRYFNPFIEAIWNHHYIDNIQITLSEDMPVGTRGGYYDKSGAIRDMFQNHILQIMALVGMTLPEHYSPESVHEAKIDFLKSIPSFTTQQAEQCTVRGQYQTNGNNVVDYLKEPEVDANSTTETFLAGRIRVNNERWQGVPFYFRTGKALGEKYTTVQIILNPRVYKDEETEVVPDSEKPRLTFFIQPECGVQLYLNEKQAGQDLRPQIQLLDHDWRKSAQYVEEPYEKLIYNTLLGDPTYFTTWNELREQWRIVDSIIAGWHEINHSKLDQYPAGTHGPKQAYNLLERYHNEWIDLD